MKAVRNMKKHFSEHGSKYFGASGVFTLSIAIFLILYDYGLFRDFFFEKFIEDNSNYRIPLVAIGAALLTFAAFLVQVQANSRIQDQFKIQQFESQFYKMLDLHKLNVQEMKLDYVTDLITDVQIHERKEDYISRGRYSTNQVIRSKHGRQLLNGMYKEIKYLNTVTNELFLKNYKKDLANYKNIQIHLLRFSYELFFTGIPNMDGEVGRFPFLKLAIIGKAYEKYNSYSNKTVMQKFKNEESVLFDFLPFNGHEHRLAHYYRNLYATVKLVVDKFPGKYNSKNYWIARRYLKVLRAQLSNSEQLLLYYNYRIGYGRQWEWKNKVNIGFLSKYRMIHNLPVDRIYEPESPRVYFKDYITKSGEVSSKDPLFEWGDFDKQVVKPK